MILSDSRSFLASVSLTAAVTVMSPKLSTVPGIVSVADLKVMLLPFNV